MLSTLFYFVLLVVALGILAAIAGMARKMRGQRNDVQSPQSFAAAAAERKAIADRLTGVFGKRPEVAVAPSVVRPRKKIPRMFFVPFALFGAFFVYIGAKDLVLGYNSAHWPRTDGVITSASVEQHRHSGRHNGTVYAAKISYDYKVAGVAYTGTRVRFGMVESSAENAQAIVNSCPPGRQVAVFYSPADPDNAVLQTGIFGGVWLGLGLGGLFLAIGVVGLVARRNK